MPLTLTDPLYDLIEIVGGNCIHPSFVMNKDKTGNIGLDCAAIYGVLCALSDV